MIGIIIPVYNRSDRFEEALCSLVGQNKKNFIVVVVDDGSTEPIEEVVNKFKSRLNIQYIKKKQNEGVGLARKDGLSWCYNNNDIEYIMFLDSDDILFPDAVLELSKAIVDNRADMVSSTVRTEQSTVHSMFVKAKNRIFLHGKIFDKRFLIRNSINFDNLTTNEDMGFLLKVVSCTTNIVYLSSDHYYFRKNLDSLTHKQDDQAYLSVRSAGHIEAVYKAIIFIQKSNRPLNIEAVQAIIECYNFYQRCKVLKIDTTKIKAQLQYLYRIPEFLKYPYTAFELNNTLKVIEPGFPLENQVYWYEQSYADFVREMLG